MKNKKRKLILITALSISALVLWNIIFMVFKNNLANVTLDDVILVDSFDSNMFAIMLEQKDASGNSTYVEDKNRTSWPTDGYAYNSIKSGCIDSDVQ